jgi:hypothetical protein
MKFRLAPFCVALIVSALLVECSPSSGVSVTNHYGQPIARVVIRDAKGTACLLERIAPGATAKCANDRFAVGELTYEINAANLKRTGLLGFVNAGAGTSGGMASYSIELRKDGTVSTSGTNAGFVFG